MRSFTANTCSVILHPVWYAACVTGILVRISPDTRFIMMIASILRRSESRMIGLTEEFLPANQIDEVDQSKIPGYVPG